ncbi:hypothetical protein E2C01_007332 [Portunus trituberculatus]|uniref:Uncharacterized protein n=1 Tax=Portunus trituberculatus TaxID=210409 RepID=A0A5B7D0V8_PORTR|nr:hypothetical protein [Portunus trituberculatus]
MSHVFFSLPGVMYRCESTSLHFPACTLTIAHSRSASLPSTTSEWRAEPLQVSHLRYETHFVPDRREASHP